MNESAEALISPGGKKGLTTEEDDSIAILPAGFDPKNATGTAQTVAQQEEDGLLPPINNRFRPKDENP